MPGQGIWILFCLQKEPWEASVWEDYEQSSLQGDGSTGQAGAGVLKAGQPDICLSALIHTHCIMDVRADNQ